MSMPLHPAEIRRLGSYELLGRLGRGGMGAVYLARNPGGRQVAIKVIRDELADDEMRARFRSEVNRLRQVPSFCTAAVLDADVDHDPAYLVVEYVDGPSLAEVVRERGPLPPESLHSVAVGITTALAAIHGAGVIHRDLKPENVLLPVGGVKVIDFGIARSFEATSLHTRTDQMVGTVAYMAPERFDSDGSRTVTPAADVFAWGVLVAFAATGRTPFGSDSPPATAMRILTQPPDLSGLRPPLRGLVEAALHKHPAHRPTARQLLDTLLSDDGRATTPHAPNPATHPASEAPRSARPALKPPQAAAYQGDPAPDAPMNPGHPATDASNAAMHRGHPATDASNAAMHRGHPATDASNAAMRFGHAGPPPQRAMPGPAFRSHGTAKHDLTPPPRRRKRTAVVAAGGAVTLTAAAILGLAMLPAGDDDRGIDARITAGEQIGGAAAGTNSVVVPSAGPKKATTPRALLELLSRIYPDRKLTRGATSDERLWVQALMDEGAGPGRLAVSVYRDKNPDNPVRTGAAPEVTVQRMAGNCIQDVVVTAHWDDGTNVQVDVSTCLPWNGKANPEADPPLTVAEAKEVAADPRWGVAMDAEIVDAGAEHFPRLIDIG